MNTFHNIPTAPATRIIACSAVTLAILLAGTSTTQANDDAIVSTMSHGEGTACAVTLAGHVKCWGVNDHGQLGRGDSLTIGDNESPADVGFIDLGGTASQVFTNGEQSFALMSDGTVRAWGLNDNYQLGLRHNAEIGDDETPAASAVAVTPNVGGSVVELAASGYFACARLDSGAVRCWGHNDFGQLGYGHTDAIGDDEDPADAGDLDLGGTAVALATGAYHACAILDNGAVRCWGHNDMGQLGYGHTSNIGDDEVPATTGYVDLGQHNAVKIVAGWNHTCAQLDTGELYCWGYNVRGQLGYGSIDSVGDDEVPSAVGPVALPADVADISAGKQHSCALLTTGKLYCWGANGSGQLGYGTLVDYGDDEAPTAMGEVDLGGYTMSELFSGATADKTCGKLSNDALRCWGANDLGQLGYGHTSTVNRGDGGGVDSFVLILDDSI